MSIAENTRRFYGGQTVEQLTARITHLEAQLEKVRGLAERLSWLTPVAEELTAILQPASDEAGSS